MFGFLKQKIADFGKKLNKAAQEKEETPQKEEKQQEKKENKQEDAEEEKKRKEIKKEEKKKETEEKKETNEKKGETIEKKHEERQETKIIEKAAEVNKTESKSLPEEKKKEATIEKETPKEIKHEEKHVAGKKKKTKEEIAEELEAKMFKEIEGELREEGAQGTIEAIEEEKKEAETAEVLEEAKKEIKNEEIKAGVDEEKSGEEIKGLPEIKETKKMLKEKVISEAEGEVLEEEEIAQGLEEEAEEKEEEAIRERSRDIHINTLEEDKRELKAHVGAGGKLKGFIFGGVEISEGQINDLLWELELSLIESDVEQDAARELVKQIKERLVGKKVSPKNLDEYLNSQIKEILTEMMKTDEINLLEEAKKHKPLKILMLGPNGAGKTTSIAKLVHYFKKHGLSSVVAAGDTFRAGAIDQIEEHAKRLNVRVIKQQYGADPAAVSFDAIKAAEAGGIDVVIIDSAGRQETNKNLMEELRKIERVAKPDLKIYVGEAYVGQALLEQVEEFKEMIGIDGFILTKIDTDAKGGTAISLLYKMKKPIIFVGTGQGYDDFKEFTPEFILERII